MAATKAVLPRVAPPWRATSGSREHPREALTSVANRDLRSEHLLDQLCVEEPRSAPRIGLRNRWRDPLRIATTLPAGPALRGIRPDSGTECPHLWIEAMALGDTSVRLKAGGCRGRQAERPEDSLDESVVEGPTI